MVANGTAALRRSVSGGTPQESQTSGQPSAREREIAHHEENRERGSGHNRKGEPGGV